MKQWGGKLNAFHKQELPSHLLQLAASEQTGNSSVKRKKKQNKKKKRASSSAEANRNSLESLGWVSLSSCCCTLNSLFTIRAQQQAPRAKQHAHLDTYFTCWLKYASQWDPRACGTSCLHLFNIVLLLFPMNISPLLLSTQTGLWLYLQPANASTFFPGRLLSSTKMHSRQHNAVKVERGWIRLKQVDRSAELQRTRL